MRQSGRIATPHGDLALVAKGQVVDEIAVGVMQLVQRGGLNSTSR